MFALAPTASQNGWLLGYPARDYTEAELMAKFGAPFAEGWEPEKGYGDGWLFTEEATGEVIHLHPRWGIYRLAGTNPEAAERFSAWLATQLP